MAPDEIKMGTPAYYAVCSLGGSISCSSTHVVTLPLDIIKCRMQYDPVKYSSPMTALKLTLKEDGVRGLARGWGATLVGYGSQGVFRFGLYEYFKIKFAENSSPETFYKYRTLMYLASAAAAESIADIPLAPFEALKVRTQTNPNFPVALRHSLPFVIKNEGLSGLYKSLPAVWGRQIPYTMVKFTSFERVLEFLYRDVVGRPKESLSKGEQLVVTFGAGYSAGVLCAIASHPADTMISKLQAPGATMSKVFSEIGFMGLWKGLGPRILMIGAIAACQWFTYDAVKVAFNLERPPPPQIPK